MKAFISGGAKNGKTTLGQDLAVYLAAGEKHYYVATMISADAEDDERIRRHIADRAGLGFETIECPRHILSCLDTADKNGVFLLDSVTALLQNEIFPPEKNYALDLPAAERCARELLEFVRSVRSRACERLYFLRRRGVRPHDRAVPPRSCRARPDARARVRYGRGARRRAAHRP